MLSIIKNKKGFTLIELLVVIAILSILLVIVLVAINPAKQTRDARNTQRRADVLTILNGVNQYFVDEAEFPSGTYAACTSPQVIGINGADIANGTAPQTFGVVSTYIAALPVDPGSGFDQNDTGYTICQGSNDRITVAAPGTEGGIATISATR